MLLACSGFLWSLFLAPAAQFLNEFLRTERGFSGAMIAVFVLVTNTPAGIGIVAGGKLADRHGRRVIGAIGVIGGVGFTVVSYLSWGWPLWLASLTASVIGALAVPALAVYGPELFPTGQRGAANGGLQVVSVAGSSPGLLLAGWMADRLGGLGPAMAVLAVGPADPRRAGAHPVPRDRRPRARGPEPRRSAAGRGGPGGRRHYHPLTMRKWLLAVVAVLVLSLAACGGSSPSVTSETLPATKATLPPPTTLPCGDETLARRQQPHGHRGQPGRPGDLRRPRPGGRARPARWPTPGSSTTTPTPPCRCCSS